MYIIGTAGHVDHGKTSLVKALTGKNTDSLKEEQRRKLTIDLGFARLTAPDGSCIGVVDVPGHERFIRNMASGIWALQCALLVVAADDGWMTQTQDHALLLKGMDVPAIIAVITKIDLVSKERSLAVCADALSRCNKIFSIPCASVLVSATTLEGMDTLRSTIFETLKRGEPRAWPSCMYIDRVFSLTGTGTIVTGSLMGRPIREGDQAMLLPGYQTIRIRSIQSHDNTVSQAETCTRTALNIQGVKQELVEKGMVITQESQSFFVATEMIVLITGIIERTTIRNHQMVLAVFGTDHVECRLHVIGTTTSKVDTTCIVARMSCNKQGVWFWQQRIVFMQPGGSSVICYGTILSDTRIPRHKIKNLAHWIYTARVLPTVCFDKDLFSLFSNGYGLYEKAHDEQLFLLGETYRKIGSWYVELPLYDSIKEQMLEFAKRPNGISSVLISQQTKLDQALIEEIGNHLVQSGLLHRSKSTLTFVLPKTDTRSDDAKALYQRIAQAGFYGIETKILAKNERSALSELLREKAVVIIGEFLVYTTKTYHAMTALILKGKFKGAMFTIADAKIHLPLSRKYMIPLLNKMEEERIVERIGDSRRVL
ncbi:MAG: selenocysteine-specific translation elongation factor [Sphaerochaetaceae bacterium]